MLAVTSSVPCSADGDRFFLKAAIGRNDPSLPNLSDELDRQGSSGPDPGYSLNVSLGRTLLERSLAVELYFAVALYSDFSYVNSHENFTGDLTHYDYALIAKKRIPTGSERIVPWLGAGGGYGVTNLIAGGGKIGAFEAFALAQIEVPLGGSVRLLFEGTYCAGLSGDRFDNPHLENVSGDILQDSDGNPLEDRYSAFEFRIGVTIWLRPQRGYSGR
jgi:hypothetical protein